MTDLKGWIGLSLTLVLILSSSDITKDGLSCMLLNKCNLVVRSELCQHFENQVLFCSAFDSGI